MSDGIFLVSDGRLAEMDPGDYVDEYELQSLLEDYPALLSGAQVNADSPRRWLLIRREAGLATHEGGSDQFSVDHLFVDQDAIPTIVEVKRSRNTQIRREIVGQMLDYAANGVKYWPVDRLRDMLTTTSGGVDEAARAVATLLDVPDGSDPHVEADAFWASVEDNLTNGRLRLLFVADRIPDELARIIEFLNEQMHNTEVLGIALARHRAGKTQVLSATVVGRTQRAATVKGPRPSVTLESLAGEADDATRAIRGRLDAVAVERGWVVKRNSRSIGYVMADGAHTLCTWYPGWNSVEFYLGPLTDRGAPQAAEQLQHDLEAVVSRPLTSRSPNVPSQKLLDAWDDFVESWLPTYEETYKATWGHPS